MTTTRLKKDRYPESRLRRPRKRREAEERPPVDGAVANAGSEGGGDVLAKAIRGRKVVTFHYDGRGRTVEPHCYGISTAGNFVLRGYQTRGLEPGEPTGWRLFKVNKIANIRDTGKVFRETRPGYNPNDRGMSRVHCNL